MRELRNIVIFSEVAKCQSFSRAAKNLLLTPSAVSMSVQKLELILGTRLLNRTTRQLHLTADGTAFLEYAQQGLSKIYEGLDLFEDRNTPATGPLRISMVSSLGRSFVIPAMPQFLEQYPGITIDIGLSDQVPDLVRDNYDLGLSYGEGTSTSHIRRLLCSPSMVLVASASYLKLHGAPSHPNDLSDHRIINVRLRDGLESSWTLKERVTVAGEDGRAITFLPQSTVNIIENYDAALDAAVAGLGIALVLRRSANLHLSTGALVAVLPSFDTKLTHASKIFIVYPSKKYLPARVRVFIDFLISLVGNESTLEFSGDSDVSQPVYEKQPLMAA